ncbi:MAG: ABC transporter ATP-binding protein [Chloroflexaceae bacterium]|nr:ABC transporter ATP-binding protein [Chloroflexaceae bacterium]
MPTAIHVNKLSKRYGSVQSLSDVSFEVPQGSIFGFLGPNGAGKTTTMRILAGLNHASSGSASINGVPVTPEGQHRMHLGYLAQEPKFYSWMSGREVLHYVTSLYGKVDKGRVEQLLKRVGIAHAADRPTGGYSGGMRQRLGIAQALIGNPTVIMLDEPVSALDPTGRAEVLDLMRDLKGETTVFYSTHILGDVERVSDHVAILHQGRLVAAATTAELLGRFTRDTLLVRLQGADNMQIELQTIGGVRSVMAAPATDDIQTYEVVVADGAREAVQRAITRLAAKHNLALLANEQQRLDLETVFLRLVQATEA